MRLGIIFAAVLLICGCDNRPHVEWEKYTQAALSEAAAQSQPAVIYFYAAWCGPCHHLKDKTFTDPRVIEALAPFRRLKADMSFRESPKTIQLSDQYGVHGLPTLLFIDSQGREIEGSRIRGFVPPDRFLEFVREVLGQA